MPNYRVKVKVIAEVEYEVEVEASSYAKAEDAAAAMWREKTPSDFQVDKGYITDWEIDSEQTTAECERCGVTYPIPTADEPNAPLAWSEDHDYCAKCGAQIVAEEAAA